ncbi:unnamed protein product [Ectocarpus sp. CCAP 1310/34]|nr:unnamed protein product [Ectocarpus sp. CCAP 1310/34]
MWDPLSGPDYALLALVGLHQASVLVLAVVVHLISCRDWPPYLVKNVPLVCVTGVAGFIHLSGVVISFGFWEYSSPSLWSNCFFQGVLVSTGAGLYFAGAVVRVYRNYKVLMLHTVDMLPPTVQILIVQAPMWVAAMFLLIPSVASFDFEANRCKGNARHVLLGAFNYAGLLVIGSVYLLWKMRDARRQMTEYRAMMVSLVSLLVMLAAVNLTAGKIAEDDTLTRRIALLNNMVRGLLLFWPVIFTPLCKYAKRDQRYAERFSAGMRPSITPAMLRASLADQLKVDKLWALFGKIAEERLPPALPGFYKAVMDRDKEEGHFQRQAMTMDIIDTYIADNAVCRVDLTEACRDRILASEVTRYTIFSEAAAEVLEVLQERCEMAFQASPAYEELLRKAEQDEAQMEALDKANLLPKRKGVGFDFDERQTYNSRSDRWTNSTVAASFAG